MLKTSEEQVPVTREGAVMALKLVMIVLAAVIFWQSALAVSAEFQVRGFVTARVFANTFVHLIVGVNGDATFPTRLAEFITVYHRAIALVMMMAGAVGLIVRYLALGRVFDYLYLESEVRQRRLYIGFLVNIMVMLAHAGAIYGVVVLGTGDHATEVPIALLLLLVMNLLWFIKLLLGARRVERRALRGVAYLAGTSLTAAVVLFCATWVLEATPATNLGLRGSQLIMLSAGVALALCLADAFVQGRLYWTGMPSEAPVKN